MKRRLSFWQLGFGLLSASMLIGTETWVNSDHVLATPANQTQANTKRNQRAIFAPPKTPDRPKTNSSDANRSGDQCPTGLSPLLFTYKDGFQTASSQPTFWVYLPYQKVDKLPKNNLDAVENGATIRFVLRIEGEKGKGFYDTKKVSYPLNGPGFVYFRLPSDKALTPDVNYTWEVAVYCTQDQKSIVRSGPGGVRRVAVPKDLPSPLPSLPTLAQIYTLGEQGIWYDTVNGILTLKRQKLGSNEVENRLQELLKLTRIPEATAGQAIQK